jgi:hypothetical protein
MSRKLSLYLVFFLLLSINPEVVVGAADEAEIRSTVGRFLRLNSSGRVNPADARQMLTGEALEMWVDPSLGEIPGEPGTVVLVRDDFAVCRVTGSYPDGGGKDLYFYLERKESWKISALRTLALTGIPELTRRELEEKKGALTDDEDYVLRNLSLTLSTDQELRDWFGRNKASLGEIARSATPEKRSQICRHLGLSRVEQDEDGAVTVVVGGMTDNTVGFLYLPLGSPPPIDPGSYIWVESLGNDWYLFRTT